MNLHRICCCDEPPPAVECSKCGPGNSLVRAFRVTLGGYANCDCGPFPNVNGSYYCLPVLPFSGDYCLYRDGPVDTYMTQGKTYNVYFNLELYQGGGVRLGHTAVNVNNPLDTGILTRSQAAASLPTICQEVAGGHSVPLSNLPINSISWFTGTGAACSSGCGTPPGLRYYDARFATGNIFTVVD